MNLKTRYTRALHVCDESNYKITLQTTSSK